MSVYEKIEAQRKGKEYTDVWMVGQQLMDTPTSSVMYTVRQQSC